MCRGNAAQAVGSSAVATVQRAHSPTSAEACSPPRDPTPLTPASFRPRSHGGDVSPQAPRIANPCGQEAGPSPPSASRTATAHSRPPRAAFEHTNRTATGKLQKEAKCKKRQKKPASKAHGRLGSSGGSAPMAAHATPTEQLTNMICTCSRMANTFAASRFGKALIVACCIWSTIFLGLAAIY